MSAYDRSQGDMARGAQMVCSVSSSRESWVSAASSEMTAAFAFPDDVSTMPDAVRCSHTPGQSIICRLCSVQYAEIAKL